MKPKVLITGIDSFTGEYLSSYLQTRGYDIFGTSYTKSSHKNSVVCDITDKKDLEHLFNKVQPDYVIHLAGISYAAYEKSDAFYNVNTIGTLNLLETLHTLSLKPKKIILASSATVYGNQNRTILDESLCPHPANHYGASKYAMESLARNYFSKLNILITRPFNYTAPGQAEHFLIPKIVQHFKEKQKTIELGNINVSREFNDIFYVCEVYKRLLECETESEVVNIATNRAVKLLDIIKIMNTIAGYEIEVKVNPAFVRKDDIAKLTGSTTKLKELIGEVKPMELETLLELMYRA